jgi:Tol biopolymer transport system component
VLRADVWSWSPGTEVVRLSPGGDGAWYQACVHPDGDHAVFWGGLDTEAPAIWRSPVDRSAPERLAAGRHPNYGIGGDRVAFAVGPGGVMADENTSGAPSAGPVHLFTMAPDGTDVRQVTDGDAVDQRPAISPDGSTIAFISSRGFGVWLVAADGSSEPTQLCGDTLLYRPWWVPDGDALYTFRITRERRQVGRLDLAGGTWTPLENDDRGNTHGPFVDPGGEVLLVHSDRDGSWRLWELPLDGSPMRRVEPPGHEDRICAHGTRARNGVLVFDEAAMTELTAAAGGAGGAR